MVYLSEKPNIGWIVPNHELVHATFQDTIGCPAWLFASLGVGTVGGGDVDFTFDFCHSTQIVYVPHANVSCMLKCDFGLRLPYRGSVRGIMLPGGGGGGGW